MENPLRLRYDIDVADSKGKNLFTKPYYGRWDWGFVIRQKQGMLQRKHWN